jgi:hypothetical protein
MTTWIKPSVGWAPLPLRASAVFTTRKEAKEFDWMESRIEKIALIPYRVARKSGLLRRPK